MFTITPVPPDAAGQLVTPVYVGPRAHTARLIGRYLAPLPSPLGDKVVIATGRGVIEAAVEHRGGAPTIRFTSCPDVALVYDRLIELQQTFLHLDAAPIDTTAPATPGRCRVCGCTMERACACGCWWADNTETLCKQHGT